MRKQLALVGFVLLAVVCGTIAVPASPAAQAAPAEKPTVYTYVAEWAVPRAMWGAPSRYSRTSNTCESRDTRSTMAT